MEQSVKQTIYLSTKDNKLFRSQGAVGTVVDFLSMFFIFLLHDSVPWPLPAPLRSFFRVVSLDASYLRGDAFAITVGVTVSTIFVMFATAAYVMYQVFRSGGAVASVFALRVVRILSGFTVTVLFLPLLRLLVAAVQCDEGKMAFYDGHDCFSPVHLAFSVPACLAIGLFVPFALSVALLVFDFDASSRFSLARPDNRLEVCYIIGRITLVLVLTSGIMPLVVFLFILVTGLPMALSVLFPPYFSKTTNMMRTGMFGANFAAGTWTFIFLLAKPLQEKPFDVAVLVILAGTMVAGALAAGLTARWRWKALAYAAIGGPRMAKMTRNLGAEDLLADVPEASEGGSSLTPDAVSLSTEEIQALLKRSVFRQIGSMAEMRTRFLRTHSSTEHIRLADAIYQEALRNNPSYRLHALYATFLLTYGMRPGAIPNAPGKARRVMDAAKHLTGSSWLDSRYIIFHLYIGMQERARLTSNSVSKDMSTLQHANLRKNQHRANVHTRAGKQWIQRMWTALALGYTDEKTLASIAQSITHHETKAAEAYDYLLTNFPNSVQVVRAYAAFLSDVVGDMTAAEFAVMHGDAIEERLSAQAVSSKGAKTAKSGGSAAYQHIMQQLGEAPKSEPPLPGSVRADDNAAEPPVRVARSSHSGNSGSYRSFQFSQGLDLVSGMSDSDDMGFVGVRDDNDVSLHYAPTTRRVNLVIRIFMVALIVFFPIWFSVMQGNFHEVRDTLLVGERVDRSRRLLRVVLDTRNLEIEGVEFARLYPNQTVGEAEEDHDHEHRAANDHSSSHADGEHESAEELSAHIIKVQEEIIADVTLLESVLVHLRDVEESHFLEFHGRLDNVADLEHLPLYIRNDEGELVTETESIWVIMSEIARVALDYATDVQPVGIDGRFRFVMDNGLAKSLENGFEQLARLHRQLASYFRNLFVVDVIAFGGVLLVTFALLGVYFALRWKQMRAETHLISLLQHVPKDKAVSRLRELKGTVDDDLNEASTVERRTRADVTLDGKLRRLIAEKAAAKSGILSALLTERRIAALVILALVAAMSGILIRVVTVEYVVLNEVDLSLSLLLHTSALELLGGELVRNDNVTFSDKAVLDERFARDVDIVGSGFDVLFSGRIDPHIRPIRDVPAASDVLIEAGGENKVRAWVEDVWALRHGHHELLGEIDFHWMEGFLDELSRAYEKETLSLLAMDETRINVAVWVPAIGILVTFFVVFIVRLPKQSRRSLMQAKRMARLVPFEFLSDPRLRPLKAFLSDADQATGPSGLDGKLPDGVVVCDANGVVESMDRSADILIAHYYGSSVYSIGDQLPNWPQDFGRMPSDTGFAPSETDASPGTSTRNNTALTFDCFLDGLAVLTVTATQSNINGRVIFICSVKAKGQGNAMASISASENALLESLVSAPEAVVMIDRTTQVVFANISANHVLAELSVIRPGEIGVGHRLVDLFSTSLPNPREDTSFNMGVKPTAYDGLFSGEAPVEIPLAHSLSLVMERMLGGLQGQALVRLSRRAPRPLAMEKKRPEAHTRPRVPSYPLLEPPPLSESRRSPLGTPMTQRSSTTSAGATSTSFLTHEALAIHRSSPAASPRYPESPALTDLLRRRTPGGSMSPVVLPRIASERTVGSMMSDDGKEELTSKLVQQKQKQMQDRKKKKVKGKAKKKHHRLNDSDSRSSSATSASTSSSSALVVPRKHTSTRSPITRSRRE